MRSAAFLVLFFALAGCEPSGAPLAASSSTATAAVTASPAERASQCRDVLAVVTRAADESQKITGHITGDGTRELEALAVSAKKSKADVEAINITDAALAAARDKYAAMLGATSTAASDVVAAAREQDFQKLETANDALTKAVDSEPNLVGAIQSVCAVK